MMDGTEGGLPESATLDGMDSEDYNYYHQWYTLEDGPQRVTALVFYQLIFFVVVIIVLFNVVSGIIIDSFGALREQDAALHAEMEGKCFVCGLEIFTLETKGINFKKHIDEDHFLWNYVNLIVTLRGKDKGDYTGWESFVMSEVANKPPAFMPSNTTVALAKEIEQEEAANNKQAAQLEQLLAMSEETAKLLSNFDKRMGKLEAQILPSAGPPGGASSRAIVENL